jgi:hypothetical protein
LLGDFTHSNNRLTYTGSVARAFEWASSISASKSGGGTPRVIFHVAKNGAVLANQKIGRVVGTNDEGAMPLEGVFTLANGEYVELWVESDDGSDVQVETGVVVVSVLG